jgi:hypothetical protein
MGLRGINEIKDVPKILGQVEVFFVIKPSRHRILVDLAFGFDDSRFSDGEPKDHDLDFLWESVEDVKFLERFCFGLIALRFCFALNLF